MSEDGKTRILTHFDIRITNYGEEVARQREIAIAGGYADSQKPYPITAKDLFVVKSVIDSRREGFDSTELLRAILFNPEHREYLAAWFKGRGSYASHAPVVLKMIEQVSQEVGKLTGYNLEKQSFAWELTRNQG